MNNAPATVTLLGKTLALRGSNGTRASWVAVVDGVRLYALRGPGAHGPATVTVRLSVIGDDGRATPVAGAEAATIEAAQVALMGAMRSKGIRV